MDFSIVLEWENALIAELDRTEAMLQAIHLQCAARSESVELIILHNPEQVSRAFIAGFIEAVIQKHNLPRVLELRLQEAPKAHYFQLKNLGIRASRGQTVIVLDSDVIPEATWLDTLIEAHRAHPEAFVSGLSYIDHEDFMGKAFAINWFFPLPPVDMRLIQVNQIRSNNFMVKRQLFLDHPYPKMDDGVTRGADNLLWKDLTDRGIELFVHHGARATHPAPSNFRHFLIRGMSEGRDLYFFHQEKEFLPKHPTIHFLKYYLLLCKRVFKNTLTQGHRVQLSTLEKPAIIATMLFYYQLFLAGGLMAKFFPSFSKTVWQI